MKTKRILLLLIIAVAILASVSAVSAGLFDFLSTTTEINGVTFKIPMGFSENLSTTNSKYFVNGDQRISIDVLPNSDGKIKLPKNGEKSQYIAKGKSWTITYKNHEINGQKGLLGTYSNGNVVFEYTNGTKYIRIFANSENTIKEVMG